MNRAQFLIEAGELLLKINDPHIRIYDATIMFYMGMSPEEAAKMPTARAQYLAGHIPGAAFFDHLDFSDTGSLYEYMLAPDEKLAGQIGRIGIANDSEVVLYTTGVLACATRAWWVLRYAGLENVRVLDGGLGAWIEAGGEIEQLEHHYPPAQFTPSFKPEMFASMAEVQAALERADVLVEDSLTQEWHDREHIPGSSCLPLTDLTNGWTAYLPDDELAERLTISHQPKRVITYCGGGIAATLNAMAHLMVGRENVAVYDGSLFEWKGEGRPVAGQG